MGLSMIVVPRMRLLLKSSYFLPKLAFRRTRWLALPTQLWQQTKSVTLTGYPSGSPLYATQKGPGHLETGWKRCPCGAGWLRTQLGHPKVKRGKFTSQVSPMKGFKGQDGEGRFNNNNEQKKVQLIIKTRSEKER